jgi:hypothetical protein
MRLAAVAAAPAAALAASKAMTAAGVGRVCMLQDQGRFVVPHQGI